jgi:hypothetical protein
MLRNGSYSAWFRTPQGEGTGIVALSDGKLTGGDTVLAYTGTYFKMAISFRLPLGRGGTRRDDLLFSASTNWI